MAGDRDPFDFEGDGDYVQQRRFKSIYDARDLAREVMVTGKQQYNRGQIPLEVYQSDARAAVEMFITEIEHMAMATGSYDLLEETPIHKVYVSPPDELLQYFDDDKHRTRSPRPEPKIAKKGMITGLWGFMTAPEEFAQEWEIAVEVRHKGPKTVGAGASTQMPVDASMDAYRHANTFLNRVGLDLEARLEDYEGEEGPGI